MWRKREGWKSSNAELLSGRGGDIDSVHCTDGGQQLLDHQLGLFHHVGGAHGDGAQDEFVCSGAMKVLY